MGRRRVKPRNDVFIVSVGHSAVREPLCACIFRSGAGSRLNEHRSTLYANCFLLFIEQQYYLSKQLNYRVHGTHTQSARVLGSVAGNLSHALQRRTHFVKQYCS